ncbi:MAG: YfiR family protein [Gemmatimonadota bacterium]
MRHLRLPPVESRLARFRATAFAAVARLALSAVTLAMPGLLSPRLALAQGIEAPVQVQLPLFFKVLTFDRNLAARVHDQVVLGLIYQGGFRTSTLVKADVMKLAERTVADLHPGYGLRVIPIDLDAGGDVEATLRQAGVNVVYVAPLRAFDVQKISRATRSAGITTLSSVAHYVDEGLAIGLGLNGDRPRILLNLAAARAEGADFGSQLLKLVTLIGQDVTP